MKRIALIAAIVVQSTLLFSQSSVQVSTPIVRIPSWIIEELLSHSGELTTWTGAGRTQV
jgi:hypothetical protein